MKQAELIPQGPVEILAPRSESALEAVMRIAADPSTDVAKAREMFELWERMDARRAKTEYQQAMKAAQDEMVPIVRDAKGEHSRYAKLETIDAAIRPIYTKHGFAISYNAPDLDADGLTVSCDVMHIGGHSEPRKLKGPLDTTGAKGSSNKTGIQGLGSTVSYLRRYLVGMIFNVILTNEDRDGGGGFIGEAEINWISDMFKQCGWGQDGIAKYLSLLGVETVAEISMRQFPMAKTQLENRLRAVRSKQ